MTLRDARPLASHRGALRPSGHCRGRDAEQSQDRLAPESVIAFGHDWEEIPAMESNGAVSVSTITGGLVA
jgi:hypothetical protein